MHLRRILPFLLTFLAAGFLLQAQTAPAPSPKPISQDGLTEALRIGGLSTEELVEIVNNRGVAFQLTDQVESSLRSAGAATPLIEAVRKNYRPPVSTVPAPPPASPAPQLPPLAQNEILTLLQVGTSSARIAQLVDQRGINFFLTPAITSELQTAGADLLLLTAVDAAAKKYSAQSPSAPGSAAAKIALAPSPTPALTSLKQVKKLYIDKMGGNLGEYLRVEIAKQLPGRFQIVLNKDDADGLLVGTGEQTKDVGSVLTGGYLGLHDRATGAVSIVNRSGTVLWSSSAGDRTLLFGPLTRGGTPEVASRLVQNLKKSLRSE